MSECGCRVVATNATGEPDTGVCCYCTYHGWAQCEEGCKQMHPFGSGRWQHVLECNSQVSIQNCSDDAEYLKAFKRHKSEEKRRARMQQDEDKENRDIDDDPPVQMEGAEDEDELLEAQVIALQAEVARHKAEKASIMEDAQKRTKLLEERYKELSAEKEQLLEARERRRTKAREVEKRVQELIVERGHLLEGKASTSAKQASLSAEKEQLLDSGSRSTRAGI